VKTRQIGIFVVLLSLIAACSPPAEEAIPFSIEVTDQLGRVVKLEETPQRIISLAPSNTEILFALGLGDKVVGVSDYCNYPPEVQEKPSIGGFSTPNIEEVVALSSDLVLATEIHEASIIPALKRNGLSVFALDPKTLDEVLESILLVGEITGKEEEASHLVTDMKERIKAVTDKTDNLPEAQRLRVFHLAAGYPGELWTAGRGTFINELINIAGGTNAAEDIEGWVEFNLETLVVWNPQVITLTTEDNFQWVRTEPRLKDTDAVRYDRVYQIDRDLIRSSPRVVEALELFAKFIHPEMFP